MLRRKTAGLWEGCIDTTGGVREGNGGLGVESCVRQDMRADCELSADASAHLDQEVPRESALVLWQL